MYEDQTFETILARMLARVPADVDKREGSIIYDALAPAAKEIEALYAALDGMIANAYADTSDREHLIMNCKTRGMAPYPANKAVLKGEFNMDVPIGSRFSMDNLNYTVTEKISGHDYRMLCETAGAAGNKHFGTLIPIAYIQGLTSAELTELLIPGEDEETTEALRTRFLTSFDSQAFGGNATDYLQKTNALQGVGGVKVVRCWDGATTVKVIFITSEYKKPTAALVTNVQQALQPVGVIGLPEIATSGTGIAPIGHMVTVEAAAEFEIDVALQLAFKTGFAWADVQEDVESAITAHFTDLTKTWETEDALIIRISGIENAILNVTGIVDVANTALNTAQANITLEGNEIPILGETTNAAVS